MTVPEELPAARAAAAPAMRWASVLSLETNPWKAAEAAATALRAALGPGPVDLALAFFTAPFAPAAEEIHAVLWRALAPGCLAGASAGGVIAQESEIEQGEALVLLGARLPGVTVSPFVIPQSAWATPFETARDFALHAPGVAGSEIAFVFADPFSLDVGSVLRNFDRHAPGQRVVGGLTSAGQRRGQSAVFLNQWLSREDGFGVALSGALRADVVVSQGCRPVGPPLTVTGGERNVIADLDGTPAAERVKQVIAGLPEQDQELVHRGLFLGRPVVREAAGRGDYLVRNVIGHDPQSGALAIADEVAAGERLRLHLRDAATAREDLELLLAPQAFDTRPAAALVFSCTGRGRRLYGQPNGDIAPLQESFRGPVPAAGFFCAGEIGPVGGRNFLHGHTASIAILRPR